MVDYYRTKDRLPTEADADNGIVMCADYGDTWTEIEWQDVTKSWDLWRPCRPSDYAPEKPREPRRVTRYAVWADDGFYVTTSSEAMAEEWASDKEGGHYHLIEIIEQLPETAP